MTKFKKGKLPKDNEERLKYLYKFQEQLRLFHNAKGQQVEEGKLSMKEFRDFQEGWFKKRMDLITTEINSCKANLTAKEKKDLLEDIAGVDIGPVKNKEDYKRDNTVTIDVKDIEED